MNKTEAHSFNISAAFSEDPYLARSRGLLGRTMSNISSLQAIPGIQTSGRDVSRQMYNKNQSPIAVRDQPQTHFSGYNINSIYPRNTQTDVYKYKSHILVSDPKARDNEKNYSRQNTGSVDHLAQYLDTKYPSMSLMKGEPNISERLAPQQYRPKSMSEAKFISVPSLTQLGKPSPIQNRGLISKIKRAKSTLTAISLKTSHLVGNKICSTKKETACYGKSAELGCILKRRVQKNIKERKFPQTQQQHGRTSKSSETSIQKLLHKSKTRKKGTSASREVAKRKSSEPHLFPPLTRSLTSYLNQQTSKDTTLSSKSRTMHLKTTLSKLNHNDKTPTSTLQKSTTSENLSKEDNLMQSNRKSARSRCSACSIGKPKRSAVPSTAEYKKSPIRSSSQFNKLKERHKNLKQHKGSRNQEKSAKQKRLLQSAHMFKTTNFDDQNHTATFKGTRKRGVNSRSCSDQSVDRHIVDIKTNSHALGERKLIKKTFLSNMHSLSNSSLNSASKKRKDSSNQPQHNIDAFKYEPVSQGSRISVFQSYKSSLDQLQNRLPSSNIQSNNISMAQTSSQQILKSNQNMKGAIKMEPAEQSRYVHSYTNTLGQSQSGRLSPALHQNYFNTHSNSNIPLVLGHTFAINSTTGKETLLNSQMHSVRNSEHGGSLISTLKDAVPGRQTSSSVCLVRHPSTNEFHTKSLVQLSHDKLSLDSIQERNTSGMRADSSRSAKHKLPPQQLSVRSTNIKTTLAEIERKWNGVIDVLENYSKRRIASMRTQLATLIDANATNFKKADSLIEKSLLAQGDAARADSKLEELLKNGFNMDQENLIERLQGELASKDQLKTDFLKLKRKYLLRKEEWIRQIKNFEKKGTEQKDSLVCELQKQINYYKSQAETLGQRLQHDLRAKQKEIEHAVEGGQGFRQQLIASQTEVQKLQDHVGYLNQILKKSDNEIDRYRLSLEQTRADAVSLEMKMSQEQKVALKNMKKSCKEKLRSQLEQLDAINKENLLQRVQQAEEACRELHRKDLEIQAEKFELRLKTYFIEIAEHESIVMQLQNRDSHKYQSLYDDLNAEKQAQVTHLTNDFKDQFERERQRLQDVINQLEERIFEDKAESKRLIEEKERAWQNLYDSRAQETLQDTKQAMQKENEMHQQILDAEHKNQILEMELARAQKDIQDHAQDYSNREQNLIREIEQLSAKLEEEFKVSEQLSEIKGAETRSQETIRELKDALKLQKQANASLETYVNQKESQIERSSKDTRQLLKRMTWVTQLKQSQIRSLKGELESLKKSLACEMENLHNELAQKTKPMLGLAKQLQARFVDKNEELASVSAKFETVLEQLNQAIRGKDQLQQDVLELSSERDGLRRELEKAQEKNQNEALLMQKKLAKAEREKSKLDLELIEGQAKCNRLEDRVTNLNKLVTNLEIQVQERTQDIESEAKAREADFIQHKTEMGEKERKLQEYFCKKLDRKVTKISNEHTKAVAGIIQSHEHQILLFEQEFQVAQTRIQNLQRQLQDAQGKQYQQNQKTRQREEYLRNQTKQIEYEVSKSIEKALGRSASRGGAQRKSSQGLSKKTTGSYPYGVEQTQTPNQMQRHQQMVLSVASNRTYGSLKFANGLHSEESPKKFESKIEAMQAKQQYIAHQEHYGSIVGASLQHLSPESALGLNMNDLRANQKKAKNSTAQFYKQEVELSQNQHPNLAYKYLKAAGSTNVRSKSGLHLRQNDLERENLPPSFIAKQQKKLLHPEQEIFNPLLTIKPYSSNSQVCLTAQHRINASPKRGFTVESSSHAENAPGILIQNDSYAYENGQSREGVSRSFELKLLQNNSDLNISEQQY